MSRSYDYTPRPQIEDHYHIRALIEAQEKRSDDRSYYHDKNKSLAQREQDIRAAAPKELKAFYCQTCKKDFLAEAFKEVEQDWSNSKQQIAFYRTKCFKGHWCQRLITDHLRDKYFYKSKKIAQDRAKHAVDVLQPFETGFNIAYNKK